MKHLIALLFVALAGCTTFGPAYEPAPPPPAGKALVYLMRTSVSMDGTWATAFSLNDTAVVSLNDKGYSWVHVDGGIYKVAVGNPGHSDYLSFQMPVREGGEYYIEYTQETLAARRVRNIVRAIKRDDAMRKLSRYSYKAAEQATIPNPLAITGPKTDTSDEIDYVRLIALKNNCKLAGDPKERAKPNSKNRLYEVPCGNEKMMFECGAIAANGSHASCWRL